MIGFAPMMAITLVWPGVGLAGLRGAQLAWMTLRAVVNQRRWHQLAAADFPEQLAQQGTS